MFDSSSNISVILGRKIRLERVKLGISQEKLAELSGLHRTYIGMVERGEKNITLLNYARIAEALNVSLHDLLSGINPQNIVGGSFSDEMSTSSSTSH